MTRPEHIALVLARFVRHSRQFGELKREREKGVEPERSTSRPITHDASSPAL